MIPFLGVGDSVSMSYCTGPGIGAKEKKLDERDYGRIVAELTHGILDTPHLVDVLRRGKHPEWGSEKPCSTSRFDLAHLLWLQASALWSERPDNGLKNAIIFGLPFALTCSFVRLLKPSI